MKKIFSTLFVLILLFSTMGFSQTRDMPSDYKGNYLPGQINYFISSLTGTSTDLGTSLTKRAVNIYTTSASTDASTSVRPFYFENSMTGIGGVGGRAEFKMTTNVALGGWSNAVKGYVEYGTSGRTTGLGSAVVGEILLSAGTTSGSYAPLESELVANSAVSTGTATSFLYMDIGGSNGTGKTTVNTNGYLFELGAGVADTEGGIFEAETVAAGAADFTHVLKIRIAGVTYYIGLNTAKTF